MAEKNGSCSASDENLYVAGTGSSKKQRKNRQGFEKVNLLVGSDEEEIF